MWLCGGSEKAAKTPSMVKAMNVDRALMEGEGALTEGGGALTEERGSLTREKEH